MATLFNTDPRVPRSVTAKILRAAKRIVDEGVPRQLTPMELVKAAMAASGVAGSLGTVAMYKLTSAITQYQVSKTFDDETRMVRKKLRGETKFNDDTREEAMRESAGRREVTLNNEGALANIPTEEHSEENRLVQVNTGGGRGTKRDRDGETMATNAPMEITDREDGEPEMALMARGSGGDGPQSKETPITPAPSISYGLPETHTTIIPWNFWFSQTYSNAPGAIALPKLSFRLNAIDDIVASTLNTPAAAASYGTNTHNVPYEGGNTRSGGTPAIFPRTLTTGASISEKPFWASYWKKLYEYYTVLGCEYKITAHNPSNINGLNSNALILYDMDAYSDTVGATGNKTPDATLPELMSYKHMKIKAIAGQGVYQQNSNHEVYEVIQGRHKPGQIARNISNDGDVKTWTKTDGSIPTLKELMNIRTGKSPFYLGFGGDTVGVNYQVEVKYIVQFKDLRESARYPATGQVPIQPTLPTDALDAV